MKQPNLPKDRTEIMQPEKKLCKQCGKEIPETRRATAKFCSLRCQRINSSIRRIGYIAKRVHGIQKYKSDVLCAYDSKCAICGWRMSDKLVSCKTGVQYSYGNEIHHIVPVCEGGKDRFDNLILLCPNCHKMAHAEIISRNELKRIVHIHTLVQTMKANQIAAITACTQSIAAEIFSTKKRGRKHDHETVARAVRDGDRHA